MGIPYYFATLIRQHKGIVSRVHGTITPDVLAIDFNCMIHQYMNDANPIESILAALRDLPCRATKFTYIAMDGLVPYAKMVQQRYRRFRASPPSSSSFDRNQISPGTPYMVELADAVRAAFPHYVVSDTLEPGEGEHKLLSWLKTLPPNQRRSITVYGLDADLILLCLAQKQLSYPSSFSLLRENMAFGKDEAPGYSTLSIWKLADAIGLPIAQYIRLCILCFGNDFMPSLGMFSLREGGHQQALGVYTAAGSPDLTTVEGIWTFVDKAVDRECRVLSEKVEKRGIPFERAIVASDASHMQRRYNCHVLDGVRNIRPVVAAFWRTYYWTVWYFTENTVPDWTWVYPYPDAPLVSQLWDVGVCEAPEFDATLTYTIRDQLQFILPEWSLRLAGRPPLFPDEFYDEETDVRMPWMKRYVWESKPRMSLPWTPIGTETRIEEWGQ